MSVQPHPRANALGQAAPDGLQASPPPVSTWRLTVVLWLLGMPGVVAGWLFARRGLEAAVIAHGLAHLLSHPLL